MMGALLARRTLAGWQARADRAGVQQSAALPDAGQAGRAKAWRLASTLSRDGALWDLEYLKASLGSPELTLGYAYLLADGCEAAGNAETEVAVGAPAAYASVRTANQELASRGLAGARRAGQDWADQMHFVAASIVAAASLAVYLLRTVRHRGLADPSRVRGGVAWGLHGERSTRTQHLLAHLPQGQPACIVLLGRLRTSPEAISREWADAYGAPVPPLLYPVHWRATLKSLPRVATLVAQGLRAVPSRAYLPPLREHAAIVFRVLLGAAMQQWWRDHGLRLETAILGHTGTADTMQLESAMQAGGTRTIHAVHGLATGPNFIAFSDEAWFRCGYDARQYSELGTYRKCLVQEAPAPARVRGTEGIYLLTNLAHPMNPGYMARGPEDEIELLRSVAAAARQVCPDGQRMVWRPHPVIRRLPAEVALRVREEAQRLGFEEQDPSEPMVPAAARARWVITSPSTAAADLLGQGILCIVVDPQKSAPGTAPACFPCCTNTPAALTVALQELAADRVHADRFDAVWAALRPAGPLSLDGIQPKLS
jgi:hypothetical protein